MVGPGATPGWAMPSRVGAHSSTHGNVWCRVLGVRVAQRASRNAPSPRAHSRASATHGSLRQAHPSEARRSACVGYGW